MVLNLQPAKVRVSAIFELRQECQPKFIDRGSFTHSSPVSKNVRTSMLEDKAFVNLQFFKEGGSNMIFSIHMDPAYQECTEQLKFYLEGRLLRLPKKGRESKTLEKHVASILGNNYVIKHEACIVDSGIISQLNTCLEQLKCCTPKLRRYEEISVSCDYSQGPYWLVTDMRAREDKGQVMVHFKPKWLAQSLSAPNTARRCRTCALQASQRAGRTTTHCPLSLVSGEKRFVNKEILAILETEQQVGAGVTKDIEGAITQFFYRDGVGFDILQKLRVLQEENDPDGIIKFIERYYNSDKRSYTKLEAISRAMTMRDCSLYILLRPREGDGYDIEARLGDLDVKVPEPGSHLVEERTEEKLQKWAAAEQRLIDGGWYTGTEELQPGEERHRSCILWEHSTE